MTWSLRISVLPYTQLLKSCQVIGLLTPDYNECLRDEDNNCDVNAECADTDGSFQCTCSLGYEGDGINCTSESTLVVHLLILRQTSKQIHLVILPLYCTDIDECEADTDTCDINADCTDTEGSYTCHCRLGYAGEGFNCTSKQSYMHE